MGKKREEVDDELYQRADRLPERIRYSTRDGVLDHEPEVDGAEKRPTEQKVD